MTYKVIGKAIIACMLCCFPAFSQQKAKQLDSLFTRLNKENNFNGNILVAENGRTVYKQSFGFADVKQKSLNTATSTFQTASISKVFTATAVLQLRDKGKLQLDDAFATYFPGFPYANITLRHLLSHTSGLPNYELLITSAQAYPDTVLTNKSIIPALTSWNQPLYFQPGEQWRYCNTNYGLLALLVEKLSQMPFAQYLRKYIFLPADMTHTYVLMPSNAKADKNRVSNHFWPTMYATEAENVDSIRLKDPVGMEMLRFTNYHLSGAMGETNVISTTEDLLKFDQALYSGSILRQKTMEEAFTPVRLNNGQIYEGPIEVDWGGKVSYGLGWVVREDPERGKIVGHDGFNGGIATIFYRNITKKQTIPAFDNTVGYDFREKIAAAVDILNNKKPVPVSEKKALARFYGKKLLNRGPEEALIYFNELRADTVHYWWNEQELNRLGYAFMHNDYDTEALETFRINILLHPESSNVYDSYAEVLLKTGRKEEAILMYKKSLALNPNNEGGKQALKQLLGK
jgi:CubicO group peptidase (beta-lactamase class C family)